MSEQETQTLEQEAQDGGQQPQASRQGLLAMHTLLQMIGDFIPMIDMLERVFEVAEDDGHPCATFHKEWIGKLVEWNRAYDAALKLHHQEPHHQDDRDKEEAEEAYDETFEDEGADPSI